MRVKGPSWGGESQRGAGGMGNEGESGVSEMTMETNGLRGKIRMESELPFS